MTAVEQLRAWFRSKERPPEVAQMIGDTLDTRAILELTDRLERLEGLVAPRLEGLVAPQLSKTNGDEPATGELVTDRESPASEPDALDWGAPLWCDKYGLVAFVFAPLIDEKSNHSYRRVTFADSWAYFWNDGTFCGNERDQTRRLRPVSSASSSPTGGTIDSSERDQAEAVSLTGFVTLTPDGRAWPGLAISAEAAGMETPHIILDLSKVPASAFLRPAPKRYPRRVQGWQNLFQGVPHVQGAILYSSREEADAATGAPSRIACVQIDVERETGK